MSLILEVMKIIFKNPYLTDESKIRMLQRWILVHSYIYYVKDSNIVYDSEYDKNTQQLLKLMKENPKTKTEFSYVFKNFESGTGFYLYSSLNSEHQELISRDGNLAYNLFNENRRKK